MILTDQLYAYTCIYIVIQSVCVRDTRLFSYVAFILIQISMSINSSPSSFPQSLFSSIEEMFKNHLRMQLLRLGITNNGSTQHG